MASFLATGPGAGESLPPAPGARLDAYTVIDDVVVPPEYERYVIVLWGDRVFPHADDYVGYNADYTAFLPIRGRDDDGYLWVNHEYVSYPISSIAPAIPAGLNGRPTTDLAVLGFSLPTGASLASLTPAERRLLLGEFYYNQGGSVIRIARASHKARFEVVRDPKNRRLHGLSGLALNAERTDGYQAVIAWGVAPRQQGDLNYVLATGRAAREVFPLSSDGLGARIIGTAFNCSGATTPWQTVLSAEENFQGSSSSYMGVQENLLPNGTQTEYVAGTSGQEFGLVGEKYGWIVEIDPALPGSPPEKTHRPRPLPAREHHPVGEAPETARGLHGRRPARRPHLEVRESLRARRSTGQTQQSAVAQGHAVRRPIQSGWNRALDPAGSDDADRPRRAFGARLRGARGPGIHLPRRQYPPAQTQRGGRADHRWRIADRDHPGYQRPDRADRGRGHHELQDQRRYQTRRDRDPGGLLHQPGRGPLRRLPRGQPGRRHACARPEDFEINPRHPREVLLAMTDGAPGSDGYPDSRIFQVSKTTSAVNGTQQSGGLYKIIEDRPADASLSFHWERLEQGGEAGATQGSGFAAVDNLAFDNAANVFGVTDMSTGLHNGFTEGFPNNATTINHTATGDVGQLIGVFGNNWLFFLPTEGPEAGEIIPLAYGPTRCEMTGPTFVRNTLILSVQHPSEDCIFTRRSSRPARCSTAPSSCWTSPAQVFTQNRTVSRGSNWPSNIEGNLNGPPRPCVIAIQRKDSEDRFI